MGINYLKKKEIYAYILRVNNCLKKKQIETIYLTL